jgi:hypothetical protein
MEWFLQILAQPDNVAVVVLFAALVTVSVVWLREARRNDRLLRAGAKDEMADRMDR